MGSARRHLCERHPETQRVSRYHGTTQPEHRRHREASRGILLDLLRLTPGLLAVGDSLLAHAARHTRASDTRASDEGRTAERGGASAKYDNVGLRPPRSLDSAIILSALSLSRCSSSSSLLLLVRRTRRRLVRCCSSCAVPLRLGREDCCRGYR